MFFNLSPGKVKVDVNVLKLKRFALSKSEYKSEIRSVCFEIYKTVSES